MSTPFFLRLMLALDPWYRGLRRHVSRTPPRCLHDLRATPVGSIKGEHGFVTWALGCPCGADTGAVLGYPLREYNPRYTGDAYISPLAFRCADCGRVGEIIDTGIHGYDGEISTEGGQVNKAVYRGSGERVPSQCPDCGASAYGVTIEISFPHFDIIEDDPKLKPRAQDYFMSFDCCGHCHACGRTWSVGNFELA